jgi:Signal transduction histidine kinase
MNSPLPLMAMSTYFLSEINGGTLIFVISITAVAVLSIGACYMLHNNAKRKWKKFFSDLTKMNTLLEQQVNTLQCEKKDLIRKLGDARAKGDEADLLKANFLANMSHEIRTPMNGIIGFVQLLYEDIPTKKRIQFIDIIINSGYQLVNLFDNLVDISRMESGLLVLCKAEFNLNELLFNLYVHFNAQLFKESKKKISLRYLNLADDEVNIITTDQGRLNQVFSHLINNAIKFTEQGTVEFGFANKGANELLFFVRDSGIGISEAKHDLIFERFQQVEQGSTRRFGGTGLGLYLAKGIVEALDGKIWFESTEGEGSTFFFTLPFKNIEVKQDMSVYHAYKKDYNWANKTILIVDNAEANYQFVADLLINTRATVVRARSNGEAIKLCDSNLSLNLILMDTHPETIDGSALTIQIRKTKSKSMLPIIAQTSYARPEDDVKYIEMGCNDIITKPINPEILFSKINRIFSLS